MEKQSDLDNNTLLKGADSPGNSSGSSMTPMLKANACSTGKGGEKKIQGYAEKLCAFYVNRPKLAFAITLSIQLCMMLGTGVLYLMEYDIFPYDFTQVPLNLEKDATKLRADAFNFVTEDPRIDLLPTTALHQQERTWRVSPLSLVYKSKNNKNIISRKNLMDIDKNEKNLHTNKEFQKICHRLIETGNCSFPMSVIRLFDGTFSQHDKRFYDPNFERIDEIFELAYHTTATKSLIAFNLDKRATFKNGKMRATGLRSLLFCGMPLAGFEHSKDQKSKQEKLIEKTLLSAFADTLFDTYKAGVGDMKFYYLNMDLFFHAINTQVIWDLLLAGGSLAFIFCFIWFQTGSLWITGWAVFGIMTNFFGANLVYRVILDFRYIGIFHVLSVFIILGIGADDVFIFYNTWKLMEAKNFQSLTEHLTETFRVAAGSMFVTSLTTAAAFLASAASPLLGVSSFGVFSGVLVIVNYFSICIFFPSVVVTHHIYWKDVQPACCNRERRACCNGPESVDGIHDREEAPQDDMTKLFKAVVRWFETSYANGVILHSKIRWIIVAIFIGLSVLFMAFAMQLKPDEDQVQVWPEGSNWYDIRQIEVNDFTETGESTNVIRVYMVWGLKLQDRSKCHFTDFKCKGKTVLDDDFTLNSPQCQTSMLRLCRKLKSLNDSEAETLRIRRNVATGELEVSCFIDEMDLTFKESNLTFPLSPQKVRTMMNANPNIYNASLITSDYDNYFETALGYWLSAGGHPEKKFDYYKYASYMGGTRDKTGLLMPYPITLSQGGRRGNKLRYVAVVVNTSLTGSTLKYNDGKMVYANWEKFTEEEMAKMPKECQKAFQCTPEWNNWHWLKVQGELLKGARQGIVIGLCVAFPVLVFTTCNWIIGLLATLTIGLITLGVVGLIPLVGWRLGVMESINLTLVVGLAVDYAVHLADSYVRSIHFKREDRVRYMLGHVGVSVLAGATTTLGASSFMLGAKILFFFQFGVFMFCTIGFSIVYALILFTVVVGIIGPEGDRGSLKSLGEFCKRKQDQPRRGGILYEDSILQEDQAIGSPCIFPKENKQEVNDGKRHVEKITSC